MDQERDDIMPPKFEITTTQGRGRSSRGYSGPGVATYAVDEEGNTERFRGEYISGIRHGRGKSELTEPA